MANKIVENRKYRRIKVRWPITVLTQDGMIAGETRNISADGILLCSEKPLGLSEIFFMSLSPPNHQPIEVTGKVIWSDLYAVDDQGSVFCMGFCFVGISDTDRHLLNDLVSTHLDQ